MTTLLIILIVLLLIVIIAMAVFLIPRKPKPTIEQIEKKLADEREQKYINSVLNYNLEVARSKNG